VVVEGKGRKARRVLRGSGVGASRRCGRAGVVVVLVGAVMVMLRGWRKTTPCCLWVGGFGCRKGKE
jgi:hypothetical protein